MASRITRFLLHSPARRPLYAHLSRTIATQTTERSSRQRRQYGPPRPHEYLKPTGYVGRWEETPALCDPREAQKKLDMLRRDYKLQVAERRKQFILEVETQRQERQRRMEARQEAIRTAKEERKAAKKEIREARAVKHKAFQDDLRQAFLKVRAERLEYWRATEASREAKRNEKNELLHRQSSIWIDEAELEDKITEALMDTQYM